MRNIKIARILLEKISGMINGEISMQDFTVCSSQFQFKVAPRHLEDGQPSTRDILMERELSCTDFSITRHLSPAEFLSSFWSLNIARIRE